MNKINENFITIGKLSKLTEVHIKSLRYYDEIGILRPVYIDPETNYRYYVPSQAAVVDAIQLCVELDIPLKHFQNFLSENHQIHYLDLIDFGTKLATSKIKAIEEKLKGLADIQSEINRASQFVTDYELLSFRMPESLYWIAPYEGPPSGSAFYNLLIDMFEDIKENGGSAGYDYGILNIIHNSKQNFYLFTDLLEIGNRNNPHLYHVPEGEFLCTRTPFNDIRKAPEIFPGLISKDYDKVIILSELFTGDFDFQNPVYEIKWCRI